MIPIHHDWAAPDDARRGALYNGALLVDSATETTRAFCEFTRSLVEEAFAGRDPERAQFEVAVEDYAAILADLKPRFIHHERSSAFVQRVLEERGCDLELTYFDVPRLRTSTSDGYLTSGIAYTWHPHRDTWYSAPMGQLNHWMPVYDVEAGNAMAFHLDYFDAAVPNTSDTYNYYVWNQRYRAAAATNVRAETRPLPAPVETIDPSNSITVLTPVGGMLQFSGQHLHSSVPNLSGKTRYSIDFRTVHVGDIAERRAARNVDAACTGSSIRDFIRASDLAPMPEHVVRLFDDGSEHSGDLVYAANNGDERADNT